QERSARSRGPLVQSLADGARRGRDAAADDPRRAGGPDRRPAPRPGRERRQPQRPRGPRGGRRRRRTPRRARRPRRRAAAPARARPRHPPLLRTDDSASPGTGPQGRALMFDAGSKAVFAALADSTTVKRLASRYGMRRAQSFARRFIAGETVAEAIDA